MKKVLLVIFVGIMIIGLVVGLYLVQNPQIFKPKASCGSGGCKALLSFNPKTYTVTAGSSKDVNIALDTQGLEVSGVSIIVDYNAADLTEVKPTNFDLDPAMKANWQVSLSKITDPGKAELYARYNVTAASAGFKTDPGSPVNFAVLSINGVTDSQKTLSFDSSSNVGVGVTSTDVLATPKAGDNATFTVGTGNAPIWYSCQTGGCAADTSGAHSFANDNTCGGTCTTPHTYHKCSTNNTCVVDSTGTQFADDDTCGGTCTTTSVIKPTITNIVNNATFVSSPTVVSGTSKPGANLTITIHSVQSLTGSATANSAGAWSWTLTDALNDGNHTLTVTDDQSPAQSSPTISFNITTPSNGANTVQHYRCNGATCVADQSGQYTSTNCDSTCTAAGTTTTTTSTTTTSTAATTGTTTTSATLLPTASTGDTLVVTAIGLASLVGGALLFFIH